MKPLCIDLYAGLGGWAEGALAAGYDVVGFDIERHRYPARELPESDGVKTGGNWSAYGKPGYVAMGFNVENEKRLRNAPLTGGWSEYSGQLVLQDVLTLHGSQFRDAVVIVASPPCQNYSYLAMPWSRSKDPENSKSAKALRRKWETKGPDNRLFDACFRIQREAIEATRMMCSRCWGIGGVTIPGVCDGCNGRGFTERYIPLIVENVRGAQSWVGKAKANFGSYYLWGDVAMVGRRIVAGVPEFGAGMRQGAAQKREGRNFHSYELTGVSSPSFHVPLRETRGVSGGIKAGHPERSYRNGHVSTAHLTNSAEHAADGTKIGGDWFSDPKSTCRKHGSRSNARKAASAQIAKIPFPLAHYIAQAFKPH